MTFKDHFSGMSEQYRSYRPWYPHGLFEFIASLCRERKCVWDCATGSGQSAVALSEYFDCVLASDASDSQIKNAVKGKNIQYFTAPAESSGIDTETVDCITVSQALHWFDIDAFFLEADRVLKKEGILAVWSYALMEISPAIDKIVESLYYDDLGKYWPPERKLVEEGYRTLSFPYKEVSAPSFSMTAQWGFDELIGYLNTWSSVKEYKKKHDTSPVEKYQKKLMKIYEGIGPQKVSFPLALHVRRKI